MEIEIGKRGKDLHIESFIEILRDISVLRLYTPTSLGRFNDYAKLLRILTPQQSTSSDFLSGMG